MYPYKSLSKAQLIELVNILETTLNDAIPASNLAANEYSEDDRSRLAFEVGHLSGYILTCSRLINEYKNC